MKSQIFIGVLFLGLVSLVCAQSPQEQIQWIQYKLQYNKFYTPFEDAQRFQYFRNSLREIQILNAQQPGAQFGLNQLSDRSPEEIRAMTGLGR
ncbi:hypothetical protein ACKWTF_009383 [Chironomus riparius]